MTENELKRAYLDWMIRLVPHKYSSGISYRKLMSHLHDVEFDYLIDMDGNRAEDGIDLRYRFGYERKIKEPIIATLLDNKPCSILEMMVALALRCEEIMEDPAIGNRTGFWFWNMVKSMGLEPMTDANFYKKWVDEVTERFLKRDYERDGRGSLFTVVDGHDLRRAEIWYQMNWYLNTVS